VKNLRGSGEHNLNGSPMNPGRQMQLGAWLTTRQSAFRPQVPGHGSLHFWFIQAKL